MDNTLSTFTATYPQSPSSLSTPAPFCTPSTIPDSLSYLSHSLVSLGLLASPFTFSCLPSATPAELSDLLNAFYKLLKSHDSLHLQLQSSSESLSKSNFDLVQAQNRLESVKESLYAKDKVLYELESKRHLAEKEYVQNEKRWKEEKVQLEKKNTMIVNRDRQYRHELRKMEQEMEKMKEKLSKSMENSGLSKDAAKKQGFQIEMSQSALGKMSVSSVNTGLNSKARPGNAAASTTFNGAFSSTERDLFIAQLQESERRQSELIEENVRWRSTVERMENELNQAIEQQMQLNQSMEQMTKQPADGSAALAAASPDVILPEFEMLPLDSGIPLDWIAEPLDNDFAARIKVFQAKIKENEAEREKVRELSMQRAGEAEKNRLIERLKAKIDELMAFIGDQERILRSAVFQAFQASPANGDARISAALRETRRLSDAADYDVAAARFAIAQTHCLDERAALRAEKEKFQDEIRDFQVKKARFMEKFAGNKGFLQNTWGNRGADAVHTAVLKAATRGVGAPLQPVNLNGKQAVQASEFGDENQSLDANLSHSEFDYSRLNVSIPCTPVSQWQSKGYVLSPTPKLSPPATEFRSPVKPTGQDPIQPIPVDFGALSAKKDNGIWLESDGVTLGPISSSDSMQ